MCLPKLHKFGRNKTRVVMPQRMGAFVGTLSGFSCKCLMMMVVVMMMMTGMMSVTTTMTCVYSCSVSMHHALFDVFSVHALCII